MTITKFNLFNLMSYRFHRSNDLYCVECGYVHPGNAGLEEGDICPDCGRGILIEV
jgi:hypothetical protein